MSTHSPIGPSQAKRFFRCPGSVSASKDIPNITSKYAAEGTVCHTLVERCLRENKNADSFEGDIFEEAGFEVEITEELVEAIQHCVDFVRQESKAADCQLLLEERVKSKIHPDAQGTADAIIIKKHRLVVIDYKFGAGVPVDVKDNEQLLCYALYALESIKQKQRETIEHVDMVILQPRARFEDEFAPAWASIPVFELNNNFKARLTKAIEEVYSESPRFEAGSHCHDGFCPVRATCPTLRESVEQRALVEVNSLRGEFIPPSPSDLTPEQLGNVLKNAEILRNWASAVGEHALRLAEAGEDIPGFKLTQRKKHRKWVDEDTVVDRYHPEFKDKLYTKKLISPNQLEKLLGKKRKDEASELIETPVGENMLVSVDSSKPRTRPAITKQTTSLLMDML